MSTQAEIMSLERRFWQSMVDVDAAILEGIARGEMAVDEGRTLSQEEAEHRLSRWLK